MLGLFISAGILYGLIYLVTRGQVEIEFWKLVLIALGVSAAAYGIGLALGSSIFGLLALVPLAVLLGFLLMQFCFLTLAQAATVSGVYFAVQIGIVLVFFGVK